VQPKKKEKKERKREREKREIERQHPLEVKKLSGGGGVRILSSRPAWDM
jgi:hypothetical protein